MKRQLNLSERTDLRCSRCGRRLGYVPAWGNDAPLCRKCERKGAVK